MTDIVGSTEHAAELGDSGWRDLVSEHHAIVRRALRRHRGREIDTAGDGFFAIFDAPAAAIECARDVSRQMAPLGIEIRAGIHVGEVEQLGKKVSGITVPIAARIMAAADGGEVLVSSTVRDLAAGAGLEFEGRGTRELKGVPGEWHIYALVREAEAQPEPKAETAARARRTAAVRRAASRPIWQRHPRASAMAVLGLAVIVAASGLLAWKPWQTPALASVKENSIGIIDPGRNEIVGEIHVGASPGGIAVSEGYAWVTNAADDTVDRIDVRTELVTREIDVGDAPTGIAIAGGSAWVTNSGDGTVSRIDLETGRRVQTIRDVGNGPVAIAAAGGSVWVANASDSTVAPIDTASGQVGAAIGVPAKPVALVGNEQELWVASEDSGLITRIDPAVGKTMSSPLKLSGQPNALALDAEWLWIASADGTITRVDRQRALPAAIAVSESPLVAVALSDGGVWASDTNGVVYRLDVHDPFRPPVRVDTATSVAALAVVGNDLWLAARSSAASHRGGTLRIIEALPFELSSLIDPYGRPFYNVSRLETDSLVGYRHLGGPAGTELLPDLATAIPEPTEGGLTYAFSLRPGVVYATGEPVRATDFRRGIERGFVIDSSFWGPGGLGTAFFGSIRGADSCTTTDADGNPVPSGQCDLSDGIVADDAAGTVNFHLTQPDQLFLHKLALYAVPVPPEVPLDEEVQGPFPGTGPYVIDSLSDTEVRLVRNERFSVWDAAVRPDGFPDEIDVTWVPCNGEFADDGSMVVPPGHCEAVANQPYQMVANDEADLTSLRTYSNPSADLIQELQLEFPGRWHVGSSTTRYVYMNTKTAPFDDERVRQAVNYALDRSDPRIATLAGFATCQMIPPGYPGYQPYCPYTTGPDESGSWKSPDLEKAIQLVEESGTKDIPITVGPSLGIFQDGLQYLADLLPQLGYTHVSLDKTFAFGGSAAQISLLGWGSDYFDSSSFVGLFSCDQLYYSVSCDPSGAFDARFHEALQLMATDPAAANDIWTELDRWAVDHAVTAPVSNFGADFVSSRVGNYQYTLVGEVLYDQMWVQ